jgi:hypothetical protein
MRLIDMFVREHVHLLWVIEGEDRLRVHNGTCYFYNEQGAFTAYKGIPPESTFSRVKDSGSEWGHYQQKWTQSGKYVFVSFCFQY